MAELHNEPLPSEPLRGTAWVAQEYVFAYDIITQPHWTDPIDKEDNARWVMQGVSPEFAEDGAFASRGYSFVVAGHNFAGGGKSIEHVVAGLMGAGIQAVLADSHSRLQFRNAINYGLPFVVCRGINQIVETGDELEVDLAGVSAPGGGHHRPRKLVTRVHQPSSGGDLNQKVYEKIDAWRCRPHSSRAATRTCSWTACG